MPNYLGVQLVEYFRFEDAYPVFGVEEAGF